MVPSGEDLANASAATLREMKRLALHIPGPRRSILRRRIRAEERKLRGDDHQGALAVEDEQQIALAVEDEVELERAFEGDAGMDVDSDAYGDDSMPANPPP